MQLTSFHPRTLLVLLVFTSTAALATENMPELVLKLSDQASADARSDSTWLPTGLAGLAVGHPWLDAVFHEPTDIMRHNLWLSLGMNRSFRLRWDNEDPEAILSSLSTDADVLDFCLAYPLEPLFTPNDWNLGNVDLSAYDNMQVRDAWSITQGSRNIILATIDSGCDIETALQDPGHPDVVPNLWINPCEDANHNGAFENWPVQSGGDLDGADGILAEGPPLECQNGFVDDVVGYDFVDQNPNLPAPGEDYGPPDNIPGPDRLGHGTLVAGMAAAATNNGEGIVSPAWSVSFMVIRAAYVWGPNCSQGTVMDQCGAAAGFQYAADNGAKVISFSWGIDPNHECYDDVIASITYAQSLGVLIFAAAGNGGYPELPPPNDHPSIISVAATDANDSKAWFSNYGMSVELAAFGECCWTTCSQDACVLVCPAQGSLCGNFPDELVFPRSGTSYSAPLAASVAALVWSLDPSMTGTEVREALFSSADPIQYEEPGDLGHGRVNALKAVLRAPCTKTIQFDDVTLDPTVYSESSPYVIAGDLIVASPRLLEIHAGVTVAFEPGARIIVEDGAQIVAVGAPDNPVRFVVSSTVPEATWAGIELHSVWSIFSNCVFEKGSVAIRTVSTGLTVVEDCDFDNCGIGVAALYGGSVVMTNCNITNSRYYGALAAARSSLTMSGTELDRNRIEGSARAGVWSASIASTDLDNVWIADNGPDNVNDRQLIHGGIRNTYSNVEMNCVTSTLNNGPGLSAWGGFVDMAWQRGDNGRNVISENYQWASGRTQIEFCNARVDLCEGRNKISADGGNSTLIEDCSANQTPVEAWRNNWGAQVNPAARIPANYEYNPIDGDATSNRCNLPEILQGCILGPAAQWYDQGWQQENSLQWADAIVSYQYVISHYPTSKEAALCPDRILFCEGKLTKDWDNWRTYFVELGSTTQDPDLSFMAKTSAAWCLVELGDFEQAEAELQDLMDQADSQYKYQKAALSQLLAELKEAPWDTIGIAGHGRSSGGSGSIDQAAQNDPIISVVDRMEALLSSFGRAQSKPSIPSEFSLLQNYPNPFNPTTTVRFDLPEVTHVQITIFNTLGQEVATLLDDTRMAGAHSVEWNAVDVAAGLYVYQMRAGSFINSKKMLLLK